MTALEAFLGNGLVYVKVKDLGRIVIDFACIKIPHHIAGEVEMVEEIYDCIIKQDESHVVITPKFVRDYPFLSTDDYELRRKLRDWFINNSKGVIADLLKSKS